MGKRAGRVMRKGKERGGTRFLLHFQLGDPSLLQPRRLLVPIRSGSSTDVLTCPRRTGLGRWVQAGRNPSAHLSFRGGGWCSQIRVLSHSENIQIVRGLWCGPPATPSVSNLLAIHIRCEGKPAAELTKFVRIDLGTGQVELPSG